ncbi:MAG: hypothetical protein ABIK73_08850 [candidate division WOR-3 bacterium]
MKWIEIDELEKANSKLQQTNQKLDEINTKLDEISTKTNEINEKTTLIHDYFNKALNLEILTTLFDILQKNYIKLTAHNIQPNDLIAPHLYDLSFNGVNQYAVIGLQPGNIGTPFTVYGWSEITIEELMYPVWPKASSTWAHFSMIGDPWIDYPSIRMITDARADYTYLNVMWTVRTQDGARKDYSYNIVAYRNTWVHVVRRFTSAREHSVWVNGAKAYSASVPSTEITVLEWNPATATRPYRYQRFVLGANVDFGEWMTVRYGYVRIYDRALTNDEISQAYNQQIVSASGLRLFIDPTFFDGAKYVDLSGNGNHAYPYNNPQKVDAENKWMYIIRNMYSDGYIRFLLPQDSLVIWNSGKITTIECVNPMFFDGTHYWCLYTTVAKGDSATIYIPQ